MASPDVTGQTKALLLEQFQICPGGAFRMPARWARNSKVKLPALAVQLVWSGERPWSAVRHDERLKALLG